MKKTSILENRKLAWVALALAVLLGVFGIGTGKLKGLGREAQQYYEKNIASDMTLRVNAARSIVEVGADALDSGDVALQSAQSALAAMEAAGNSEQTMAANTDLTSSIGMLYEAVRAEIGDQKGGVLQGQWSEFTSRQNIMNNSMEGYEASVQKAREAAKGFPASLLAKLAG